MNADIITMAGLGSQLKDIPIFPKLKNLCIKGNPNRCTETYNLFPRSVSHTFPALTSVTLEFVSFWDHAPNNATCYAGPGSEAVSVGWTSAVGDTNTSFCYQENGLEILGEEFPTASQLWVDWESCYRSTAGKYCDKDLWGRWKISFTLQRLEIHRLNP